MDGHDDGEHVVTDLNFAAAMIALGLPYRGLRLGPDGRSEFIFDDQDGGAAAAERDIRHYRGRPVNPRHMIDAVRSLRHELRCAKFAAGMWTPREPAAR